MSVSETPGIRPTTSSARRGTEPTRRGTESAAPAAPAPTAAATSAAGPARPAAPGPHPAPSAATAPGPRPGTPAAARPPYSATSPAPDTPARPETPARTPHTNAHVNTHSNSHPGTRPAASRPQPPAPDAPTPASHTNAHTTTHVNAPGPRPADPVAALLALPAPPPDATAAYGDRPDQVIDLWAPRAAERPAPLAVLLHGGAWRAAYDRAHLAPFAAALATQGFAVASVEYRRGRGEPDTGAAGRWPETLDDVAAAIDAVPTLAARTLGRAAVDPDRFVLAGHSAGGHLALWAAARHLLPPDCAWRRPSPPGLRGVLAIAPIADFTTALELRVCGDAVRQLLAGDLSPTRLALTDPARLVPSGVPTTVVHGTADAVVPPSVSTAFGTATAAAGRPVRLRMVPGAGHFEPVTPGTEASGAALAALHRLVRVD